MARPRSRRHILVENAACLDICTLQKGSRLQPGQIIAGTMPLVRHPFRTPLGAAFIMCDLTTAAPTLHLNFALGDGRSRTQLIALTSLPRQPFGGRRWFFICPETGARASRLFLPAGGERFLSREAHGMRYLAEHADISDTEIERVCRLYTRISGKIPPNGALSPLPARRRGMHQATYMKLMHEMIVVQGRVVTRLATQLDGLYPVRRYASPADECP